MNKCLILLVVVSFHALQSNSQNNIYSFLLIAIENGNINLSNYQGKKILLVNSSSQSTHVQQYAELQQLYTKLKDSGLVIIAIPSNSFNAEPQSNSQILQSCSGTFGITFPLAAKSPVKGPDAIPLYKWLAAKTKNTVMDTEVKADFQKYLINSQGKLVGVFAARINPMNEILLNAIRNTQ